MGTSRRSADELLDLVRVLLLFQGAIFVATTIEAFVWALAFGAPGISVVASAATATTVLITRVRLRPDRRWIRRAVYIVEGAIIASLAIDSVLAFLIAHGSPPPVAILTRLVIPTVVIAVLDRSERRIAAPIPVTSAGVT
jgi:hypothetical protein